MINNKKILLCIAGAALSLAYTWSFAATNTCTKLQIRLLPEAPFWINYEAKAPLNSNVPDCINGTRSGILRPSKIFTMIHIPIGSTINIKIDAGVAGGQFNYSVNGQGNITCETPDGTQGNFSCASEPGNIIVRH